MMDRINWTEKMLYWLCQRILKLLHKEDDEGLAETIIQFAKFGIVGVSNTAISYILNVLVLKLLEPWHVPWDFVAGNLVAFLLSVAWSFYWNSKFVFRTEKFSIKQTLETLLRTYVAYGLTGIVLSNILSWFWIEIVSISKYIAPLINLIISVPLNFIINKFWAFRQKT